MNKQIKFIFIIAVTAFLFVAGYIAGNSTSDFSGQKRKIFDFDWKFNLGDNPDAYLADFDDSAWRNLDLPHDWSIEGKLDKKNPMSGAGGYLPSGIGWYRKSFLAPSEWQGKKISIYFEGVYMNSEVYINGKNLGIHPYGYTSFYYDLTPYLHIGHKNTIAVRVDNSKQINTRWYSGSGIYRHIYLVENSNVHIDQWGVDISTQEINAKQATLKVKTKIKNEGSKPKAVRLKIQIIDNKGNVNAIQEAKLELPSSTEKEIEQLIAVNNPKIWSPETPQLYNAKIELADKEDVFDADVQEFGIRTIKFTPEKGFELNGKTIQLNGGCVHHDNGCLGAAAYDDAEMRKVKLLKQAGFNAVRTSHNPPSEAFLKYCDRLGLLVMDESFDCWREGKNSNDYALYFDEWSQRDVESMVLRDRNHPSIIMWSIGNEIYERKKPEAIQTAKRLAGFIHQIDKTRPVTSAVCAWDKDWTVFDSLFAQHDVSGYNYALHFAPSDHQRVPSRVIVQTESYPREAFINWKRVMDNDYVIGDFVWTAMDYLGESGIGRYYYPGEPRGEHWETDFYPWHGAYCGDIDLIGNRKPISHYRNLLYNSTEKLYLAVKEPNPENGKISETMWSVWPTWECWNWPGYEGKNIDVEIYSKYPSVRLYLNNKLITEKKTGIQQEFKAVISVPYEQGTLKVEGISAEGKVAETKILKTAGDVENIVLKADRKEMKANGQDLTFVNIELTDKEGVVNPLADNRIEFNVTGPGVIVGVDNANLKDTEDYASNSRKAWHGKAMVVIKSKKTAGTILLKVSSDNLPDKYITIKTSINEN